MNENNVYYEFKDLPDKTTPLKSETLNAIQESIKNDIKGLNNNITTINNNIDGISNMVISINRNKADVNSVYTKKESDSKYANAIKQEINKEKEVQISSTGANLQNVQIFGESAQETREGYNLLKYPYANLFNDTIFTDNGDGTITLNGNLEANTSKYFVRNYFFKAGTYTFVTGLGKEVNLPNTCYILIKKSSESTYLVQGARKDTQFTLDVDSNIDVSVIYISGEYNNILLKPMILFGTEEKEFEQYGAMPSLDYHSSVTSITNIDYKITGKNKAAENVETSTVSGVTAINNRDGTYTLNGTTIQERSFGLYLKEIGKEINLKKGKTYKLVVKEFSGSKTGGSVTAAVTKETGEMVYNYITQNSPVVTATYNSVIEFINLYVAKAGITFNNYKIGIMLIEQGENEGFEPYKEVKTTIALPENVELCSLPNGVEDDVDSTGIIHKNTKKYTITGEENFAENANYTTEDVLCISVNLTTLGAINNSLTGLSNYFKYSANSKQGNTFRVNGDNIFISFNKKDVASKAEAIALLKEKYASENPVIIIYPAKVAITQTLAEIEKAKLQNIQTFEGVNNITTNAPISAIYNTDTKSYIDSKFNALAQQLLNIVGGN